MIQIWLGRSRIPKYVKEKDPKVQERLKSISVYYNENSLSDYLNQIKKQNYKGFFGGIILGSGRTFFSEHIKKRTNSNFSHCALFLIGRRTKVRSKGKKVHGFICNVNYAKKHHKDDELWVIESDKSMFGYDKTKFDGIHLIRIGEFMQQYKGDMVIEKFNKPLTQEMKQKICTFINNEIQRAPQFERIFKEFYYGLLKMKPYKERNIKYYFCSELVAEIFQQSNILQKKYSSNSYFPRDFFESETSLNQGYTLVVDKVFLNH